MKREGTGPDKDYRVKFNREDKTIHSNQKKYPLDVEWLAQQQDHLSYQVQLRHDLMAGKRKFSYPIIDKKGNQRSYDFAVVGEEMITLPFGNINHKGETSMTTVIVRPLLGFAPEYNHMLVKMFKGKDGMEQFQIELKHYPGSKTTAK